MSVASGVVSDDALLRAIIATVYHSKRGRHFGDEHSPCTRLNFGHNERQNSEGLVTNDKKLYAVAYSSTASRLFTDSSTLREKAHGYFELEFEAPATWRGSLYRASSTKPGWLSREFYRRTDAGWVRTGEDDNKYLSAPGPGGYRAQVLTFLVYSKEPITDVVQEELRKVLSIFPTL